MPSLLSLVREDIATARERDPAATSVWEVLLYPHIHALCLYRIAHAFVELQLDIRHAKVLTMGEEVVDSFYVVDRQGEKLTDKDRIAELERAVLFELSRLAPTG